MLQNKARFSDIQIPNLLWEQICFIDLFISK